MALQPPLQNTVEGTAAGQHVLLWAALLRPSSRICVNNTMIFNLAVSREDKCFSVFVSDYYANMSFSLCALSSHQLLAVTLILVLHKN